MDASHISETAINFEFYLIYLIVSLYISLFILCNEIIIILFINLCFFVILIPFICV